MIVAVKKVLNIGLTLQKPQELRNNQSEWNKLGCYQGKSFLEIKPHLMAKDAAGARSGSVGFFNPVFQSMLKKMQILFLIQTIFGINIRLIKMEKLSLDFHM